jgi:hypothetical protein
MERVPKLYAEKQIEEVGRIIEHLQTQEVKENISRESLRLVKQRLDDAIAASGGFAAAARRAEGALDPALTNTLKAQEDMAKILRTIFNKDQPDIAQLNAEFSLWRSATSAMGPAGLKEEFQTSAGAWQSLWHSRYLAWAATAGTAGYAGGGISGATQAVGALFAVTQLMKSTAWKTTSALAKNRLATGLAKGNYETVAKLATRLALQGNVAEAPKQERAKKTAPGSLPNFPAVTPPSNEQ